MWNDPIVEEVRKVRNEHAEKFNYDFGAIVADLKKQQKGSKRKFITLPPKSRLCCPRRRSKKDKRKTVSDIYRRDRFSLCKEYPLPSLSKFQLLATWIIRLELRIKYSPCDMSGHLSRLSFNPRIVQKPHPTEMGLKR